MDNPDLRCLSSELLPDLYSAFEDFLETYHKHEQFSFYPITIQLSEFFQHIPAELHVEDALLHAHTEFHNALLQLLSVWSERKRDIYYSLEKPSLDGDTPHIPYSPFDHINHLNQDKLLRVRGTIESYSDFTSVPVMYKFECPSCGQIMHSRTHKYIDCGCSRKRIKWKWRELASRCYFSLLEKMLDKKLLGSAPSVVQCYYEIQDIIPDKPLFHKNLVGKEIDALCVVKPVDVIRNFKDEVRWVLQIRGLRLFDDAKISEERRNEVISTIRQTEDPLQTLYDLAISMRDHVAYQEDYSVVCLIASVGVNADDPELGNINRAINVVFIGDPSEGKTYVARQLLNYLPNGHFHVGRQNEKALLGATPMVSGTGEKTFVVKVGLFKIADNGFIIFDELDKLQKFSPQVMASIYTAMGDGHHTVDTAFAKLYFQYRTNVIALANFKNITADRFIDSKYAQIDIESGILRRMDAVIIYKSPYEDDSGKINDEKYKQFLAVQSGRIVPEKPFTDQFCKDYGIAVSQYKQAPFTSGCLQKIEEITTRRRNESQRITNETAIENLSKKPVDNRYPNVLKRWSKTISRLLFAEKTDAIHVEIADAILERVQFKELMKKGYDTLLDFENVNEMARVERKRKQSEREIVFNLIPKDKPIDEGGLLEKCAEAGISEFQLKKIIDLFLKVNEITELPAGHYRRL